PGGRASRAAHWPISRGGEVEHVVKILAEGEGRDRGTPLRCAHTTEGGGARRTAPEPEAGDADGARDRGNRRGGGARACLHPAGPGAARRESTSPGSKEGIPE